MVQRDIGSQRKSEMLPRPKSKPKKKASKADEKITTSLIDAMKNHIPDIGLAWVANIQAELGTISWPKSNDEGSADTFAAYAHVLIDEMGNRAPRGREVQWRNLTRLFGSLVWARFGFVDATGKLIGTPPLLDAMEPETADAGELGPGPPKALAGNVDDRTKAPNIPEGGGVTRADFTAFMKMQSETLSAVMGRLDAMEKEKMDPTVAANATGAGLGLDDLERRLAAFRSATFGGGADPIMAPAASPKTPAELSPGPAVAPAASSPGDTEKKTKAINAEAMKLQHRRIEYLSRSPLDAILRCSKKIQDFDDWPFAGTSGESRVAPFYYPQVYQGGRRGVQYAKDWIAAHKLEKCNLAHQMTVNLMMADTALLYDNANILNMASFEILARRCYGLEKAFELCTANDDWKDEKRKKVRMHLLDKYDLYAIMSTGTSVPAADQEVKKEMEVQAQFNKYLHKVEEDGHEKK